MSARATVRELMRDESLCKELRAADLVYAHDFDGSETLVQGYDALLFVLSTGWTVRARVMHFDVDSRANELDLLAVVVRVVKDVELCDFEKDVDFGDLEKDVADEGGA